MSVSEFLHVCEEEVRSIVMANFRKAQKSNWWNRWNDDEVFAIIKSKTAEDIRSIIGCNFYNPYSYDPLFRLYQFPYMSRKLDGYSRAETIDIMVDPVDHKLTIYCFALTYKIRKGINLITDHTLDLLSGGLECDDAIQLACEYHKLLVIGGRTKVSQRHMQIWMEMRKGKT